MPVLEDDLSQLRDSLFDQDRDGVYQKKDSHRTFKWLLLLGVANIALGFSALLSYLSTEKLQINYSENTRQEVFLKAGNYNLFIKLGGVFQNYLGYSKSISYSQLKGKTSPDLSATVPFDYSSDNLPYYPAGAIAYTYFTDRIIIPGLKISTKNISRGSESKLIRPTMYNANEFSIPETWTTETNSGTTPLNGTKPGIPILNERFANWISLAFFSNFNKLWGKIKVEKDGNYFVNVESDYGLANSKSVLIVEESTLGIPNTYFAFTLFTIGILCLLVGSYINRFGS